MSTIFTIIPDEIAEKHPLPEKFTFPFYYEPHPLARYAAEDLQKYLESQTDFVHNFGLDTEQEGLAIGKMFGVLVVKNNVGLLGYLAAVSGKLARVNHHVRLVPPIFDMLKEDGFYRIEENELNKYNAEIERLEKGDDYLAAVENHRQVKERVSLHVKEEKEKLKTTKKDRKERRELARIEMPNDEFTVFNETLRQESIQGKFYFRDYSIQLKDQITEAEELLAHFKDPIDQLKKERKARSNALQQLLFDQYNFLNIQGNKKNVRAIFENTTDREPPAASGECAAPKLLQYAFENNYEPICMAEFWWGAPSNAEIRKKGHFYPACRSKCEPILEHMLVGMDVDENPMLTNPALGKQLPLIYEDEYIAAVNKPHEFLSVPGKIIKDSVQHRMKEKYPEATGPLIVHRLDMSTSGIMLIAKDSHTYKALQAQFIKRQVKKRYVALLDGILEESEGLIDLPLRVDLDNRPHQMVCYEYGKKAQTKWQVIKKEGGKTKVYFYPITGRTHQLRVHASHPSGLNAAIVGDDLYGTRANRLCLHAEYIQFKHPKTKEIIELTVEANF